MATKRSERPDPVYVEIGQRIREIRQGRLSQDDLAKAISMTRASIANIEHGRQKVFAHTLVLIASALEVSASELLPKKTVANSATPLQHDLSEAQLRYVNHGRDLVNTGV